MKIRTTKVDSTQNITSTTLTSILTQGFTTSGGALKLNFTASVSAEYFSTVQFAILVDDNEIVVATEDVTANGFSSISLSAVAVVSVGYHLVVVKAAKLITENSDITINPATTDHGTLIVEEVELPLSQAFLALDGDEDKVVATGYDGVTGTSARSFSWWMRCPAFSGTKSIADYGNTGTNERWSIQIANDADNTIQLQGSGTLIGWSGSDNADIVNATDGQWHHFVMTAPSAGTYGDIKLYMDTVEQTTQSVLSGSAGNSYNTASSIDFSLGARGADGPINLLADFDEVGLFNSVLSSSEVIAIHNNGATLDLSSDEGDYASSANLQLYWKLEEGTGSSAADSSGHSRTGTITGGTWGSPGANN